LDYRLFYINSVDWGGVIYANLEVFFAESRWWFGCFAVVTLVVVSVVCMLVI